MTKIWERLYLGSLKDAAQLARSNPRRIATVISLFPLPPEGCSASSENHLHPHSNPGRGSDPRAKVGRHPVAMAIGLRRGSVLVHCREGMNRSPILVAAWMDRCGYAEIDRALSEIAKQRDLAPSRALRTSVRDLLRK